MKTNEPATEMPLTASVAAGGEAVPAAKAPKPGSGQKLGELTEAALAAIKSLAAELNITGVAVVAYAQGDSIQDWTSKMAVVGRMKIAPSTASRGNNFRSEERRVGKEW